MTPDPAADPVAGTPPRTRRPPRTTGRPLPWLAAAVGATILLVSAAFSFPPSLAGPSVLVGVLANVPIVAWLVALPRMSRTLEEWPRDARTATTVLAYVSAGILYALLRWALMGGVGSWTVPLLWPSIAVADAGCAVDLWTCPFG